jgi:hypothetical protein
MILTVNTSLIRVFISNGNMCSLRGTNLINEVRWPCHASDGYSPACHGRSPHLTPAQNMWDLRWTKWQSDRFLTQYFGFPLSVILHQCSTLIFIYILRLIEGQNLETFQTATIFANKESLCRKLPSAFTKAMLY